MCSSDCLLVLLAILFPPLPVWVRRGICSADSFINIALCCLGFLPGLIHAWYIISCYPDPWESDYGIIADETGGGRYHDHRPAIAGCRHHSHRSHSSRSAYRSPTRGMVFTIPAPQEEGYGTISQHRQPGERTPDRYIGHQQQTPPEREPPVLAGPSTGAVRHGQQHHAPPSYASVVAGDHKVQH